MDPGPEDRQIQGDVDTDEIKTFTITEDNTTYFCIVKEEHAGAGSGAGLWCERISDGKPGG